MTNDDRTCQAVQGEDGASEIARRQTREAEALRANLQRRKAQLRARKSAAAESPTLKVESGSPKPADL